jgi:DNA-binding MarR family transcriptional regulator
LRVITAKKTKAKAAPTASRAISRSGTTPAPRAKSKVSIVRADELPPEDAMLREFMADFHAAFSVMRLLRQHIAAAVSLTSAEWSALLAVWYLERKGEVTVSGVADHLHVAAAYVTSEISKLVTRGLLVKTPHPTDGRSAGINLTQEGWDVFKLAAPMLREVNLHLFSGVLHRDLITAHKFIQGIIAHGYDAIAVTDNFGVDGTTPKRRPNRKRAPIR